MSIFVTTCITFTSGDYIERDMNVGISDGEITLGDIARHFWPHVMGIMTCSSIQIYDEELEGYVDALNPDELTVGPKSNIRIDFVVSDALSVIRPPTSFLFCGTPRGSALVVGQSIRRSEQALKTVDLTKKAAATLGSNLDRKSVVDDAENQIQQPKSRKRRRRRSNRSTSPKPKPEKDSVKRPSPEIDPQKRNESAKSEICESEVLELFPLSYGDYISSEEQEESKEGPVLKSEQKLEKSHSPSRFPRDENSPPTERIDRETAMNLLIIRAKNHEIEVDELFKQFSHLLIHKNSLNNYFRAFQKTPFTNADFIYNWTSIFSPQITKLFANKQLVIPNHLYPFGMSGRKTLITLVKLFVLVEEKFSPEAILDLVIYVEGKSDEEAINSIRTQHAIAYPVILADKNGYRLLLGNRSIRRRTGLFTQALAELIIVSNLPDLFPVNRFHNLTYVLNKMYGIESCPFSSHGDAVFRAIQDIASK